MGLAEMPTGGASDATLKEDIQTLSSSLNQLLKLRPVKWRRGTNSHEYGFVASEVEQEFAYLITLRVAKDNTGERLVSTKEMIPFLISAIQEQQKQIDELRHQLDKERQL